MNDTREFINDLRHIGPVVEKKIDYYWTEVEKRVEDDHLIDPTVGVNESGDVLFSWELGGYYFEVEFLASVSIEGFWEDGPPLPKEELEDEENDYGGRSFDGPEEAAKWTVQQFANVQ